MAVQQQLTTARALWPNAPPPKTDIDFATRPVVTYCLAVLKVFAASLALIILASSCSRFSDAENVAQNFDDFEVFMLDGTEVAGIEVRPDLDVEELGFDPSSIRVASAAFDVDAPSPAFGAGRVRFPLTAAPEEGDVLFVVHPTPEGVETIVASVSDDGLTGEVWMTSFPPGQAFLGPLGTFSVLPSPINTAELAAEALTSALEASGVRTPAPDCQPSPDWASFSGLPTEAVHVCVQDNPMEDGTERVEVFLRSNTGQFLVVETPPAVDFVWIDGQPEWSRDLLGWLTQAPPGRGFLLPPGGEMSFGIARPSSSEQVRFDITTSSWTNILDLVLFGARTAGLFDVENAEIDTLIQILSAAAMFETCLGSAGVTIDDLEPELVDLTSFAKSMVSCTLAGLENLTDDQKLVSAVLSLADDVERSGGVVDRDAFLRSAPAKFQQAGRLAKGIGAAMSIAEGFVVAHDSLAMALGPTNRGTVELVGSEVESDNQEPEQTTDSTNPVEPEPTVTTLASATVAVDTPQGWTLDWAYAVSLNGGGPLAIGPPGTFAAELPTVSLTWSVTNPSDRDFNGGYGSPGLFWVRPAVIFAWSSESTFCGTLREFSGAQSFTRDGALYCTVNFGLDGNDGQEHVALAGGTDEKTRTLITGSPIIEGLPSEVAAQELVDAFATPDWVGFGTVNVNGFKFGDSACEDGPLHVFADQGSC